MTYIVNQIEMLNDMGKDPVFRFGPNAMTALDGFTGVFNASAEARFRAMEELVSAGKPVNKKTVQPIAEKYYARCLMKVECLRMRLLSTLLMKWRLTLIPLWLLTSPVLYNLSPA